MPQLPPCAPLFPPVSLQVLIYKWVPIIGPVLGSAFVIGLYVAARLLKGDLTDRMKMMDEVRLQLHCQLARL